MRLKNWLIKNRRIFWIWQIVAIAVWLVAFFLAAPYSDKLGVPLSPQRTLYWNIFDFWVLKLPMSLLFASIVAGRDFWLAPRGRYVKGKSYPIFSPYVYTAIGFMAALFAVGGILNFQLVDLPAAPAAISVAYFNPIIGFFTLWIGGVIRALVFGAGNPVLWLLSTGLSDGATWIGLGVFYWWLREVPWARNVIVRLVVWSAFYWVWRIVMLATILLWAVPANLYIVSFVTSLGTMMLTGFIAALAGVIVSEGLIRAIEARRRVAEEPVTATSETQ